MKSGPPSVAFLQMVVQAFTFTCQKLVVTAFLPLETNVPDVNAALVPIDTLNLSYCALFQVIVGWNVDGDVQSRMSPPTGNVTKSVQGTVITVFGSTSSMVLSQSL